MPFIVSSKGFPPYQALRVRRPLRECSMLMPASRTVCNSEGCIDSRADHSWGPPRKWYTPSPSLESTPLEILIPCNVPSSHDVVVSRCVSRSCVSRREPELRPHETCDQEDVRQQRLSRSCRRRRSGFHAILTSRRTMHGYAAQCPPTSP